MVLMRSPPLPPSPDNTTAPVALDRWAVDTAQAVALTLEERLFRIILTSTLAFLNTTLWAVGEFGGTNRDTRISV